MTAVTQFPEHIQRMINEYIQLGDKLQKLTAFLNKITPLDMPSNMTQDDVDLLTDQHLHMMNYQAVLAKRLQKTGVDLSKQPELSFGMKLVGIDFNPSGDPKVTELKQLAARMADVVDGGIVSRTGFSGFLRDGAIERILDAQMWAVKHVTNKH